MITVYFSVASALLLAVAFGSMIFLSLVMTPLVFSHFGKEQASPFMRKMFPRYYLVTGMCVLVATGLLVVQLIATGHWLLLLSVIIGGASVAMFWLLRQNLTPMIDAAYAKANSGDKEGKKNFKWLHRASGAINLVQIVMIGFMVGQIALWDGPANLDAKSAGANIESSSSTTAVSGSAKDEKATT